MTITLLRTGGLALAAGALLACAPVSPARAPADRLLSEQAATPEAPLGGESLAQHRAELGRAHRDLVAFRDTLETLHRRDDRSGRLQFRKFLDEYLEGHLEPLLSPAWSSEHPELVGVDAAVRLVQAELYVLMGDRHSAGRVIQEIERRFAGREGMLVEYPEGEQRSLQEALEILGRRKWIG